MLRVPPAEELWRRLPRLVAGLVLFGVGIALMVRADLGLAPWDVLHQGVAERSGIPIGMVTIVTGAVVLVLWLPLRERPGLGTLLNVLVIGLVVDATLAVVDAPGATWLRVVFLVAGIFLFGPGSGLYIGAGLGPGPRDGLMTGLARRGRSVRVVRTGIEIAALGAGAALGGSVGIGTVAFALTVGPNVHWHLDRMTLPAARSDAARVGVVRGVREGGASPAPPSPAKGRLRRPLSNDERAEGAPTSSPRKLRFRWRPSSGSGRACRGRRRGCRGSRPGPV